MGDNRRAKLRLTATATTVFILGGALLIYGIFLAVTAAASAFALIAMAVIILGIGVAVEAAGRSLRNSLREDRS